MYKHLYNPIYKREKTLYKLKTENFKCLTGATAKLLKQSGKKYEQEKRVVQ